MDCIRNASGVGLFPGSTPQIVGSSYDAFIEALLAHPTAATSLPVITSEIGDTWIYGSQSDPKKMKLARLMMRERTACSDCDYSEPAITNFTRLLLKTTEHTFGLHSLGNQDTWDNNALQAALRDTENGTLGGKLHKWTASWVEQRLYPDYAVGALSAPNASATAKALGAKITKQMKEQWPVAKPDLAGFKKVAAGATVSTAHFSVKVSATTGGLSSLVPKSTEAQAGGVSDWVAVDGYDMFQFVYRSLDQKDDFTPFRDEYTGDWSTFPGTWFTEQPGSCYDKVNLDNATCASSMGCAKSQVILY